MSKLRRIEIAADADRQFHVRYSYIHFGVVLIHHRPLLHLLDVVMHGWDLLRILLENDAILPLAQGLLRIFIIQLFVSELAIGGKFLLLLDGCIHFSE